MIAPARVRVERRKGILRAFAAFTGQHWAWHCRTSTDCPLFSMDGDHGTAPTHQDALTDACEHLRKFHPQNTWAVGGRVYARGGIVTGPANETFAIAREAVEEHGPELLINPPFRGGAHIPSPGELADLFRAPGPEAWRDKQGDIWHEDADGLMHTRETAPFPREHVERKWGPLVPVDNPLHTAHNQSREGA